MKRFAGLGVWLVAAALSAQSPDGVFAQGAVGAVLDAWHGAASAADEEKYFSYFTPDAVFLGTDATERWTRDEFRKWAHPRFAKGKAWNFRAVSRWISFSPDRRVAWFDEALDTPNMGPCRGSGVLVRGGRRVEDRAVQPLDPDSQRPRRRHREADRRGRDVEERPLTMRRRMVPVLLAALGAVVLAAASPAPPPADLVIRGGAVYTVDDARSWAEAVAVSGGKIVFVGTDAGAKTWIGPKTRVLDARRKDGPSRLPRLPRPPRLGRRRGARVRSERRADAGRGPREGQGLRGRAPLVAMDPRGWLGADALSRRQSVESAPRRDRARSARLPVGDRRPLGLGQLEGAAARGRHEGDAGSALRPDRTGPGDGRADRDARARTRPTWLRSSSRSTPRRTTPTGSGRPSASRTVSG